MCQVLQVSRSGNYAWKDRPPSRRQQADEELLKAIRKSHTSSRGLYGVRKIHADVKEQFGCGKNRVYRLTKVNCIQSIRPRKYKVTTNSRHNLPVAENLLNQNFHAEAPNKVWLSDISYIPTDEGWLYLAGVVDLCSKDVVGMAMNSTMTKELAIQALNQAIGREHPCEGLIHHSDRGVQYASHAYQNMLRKNGFIPSMSRKGNCYDNAPAESFFSTLKNELIHLRRFKTREEAKQAIFDYIEVFYNRQRRHSSLGYLSPLEFKLQFRQKDTVKAA
jgi:putative transposase